MDTRPATERGGRIGSALRRALGRRRRHRYEAPPGDPPEAYWVRRGARVIGPGGLAELLDGRQVEVFRTICAALAARGIRDVLDAGANVAALGQLLFAWGYTGRYVGLEQNPHALPLAAGHLRSARGRWRLVRANARALPFAASSIECVVMKDVLEHLEDFRPALAEAARVARRTLLVSCFLPWSDEAPSLGRDPQGFYLNRYSRPEVAAFAAERGWRTAEARAVPEADGRPNEIVIFERMG